MSKDRRMTTDRFYGGVSGRLQNLREMLKYVDTENPPREQLTDWVIANTRAGSPDAVSHHLTFLQAIDLITLSDTSCELDRFGREYLRSSDEETLYNALSTGVKGFDTLLEELAEGPMTDEDIMDLLVREFEEAEMETPGPAARHREWLQSLGIVRREDGVNELTERGHDLLNSAEGSADRLEQDRQKISQLRSNLLQSEISCIPAGRHHLSDDIYPAVKSTYPDLCNDDFLCKNAHEGGKQLPEWKHVVRDIQQRLSEREWGRVRGLDERQMWLYLPRFEPGKMYQRSELHDEFGGKRQSGIAPSAKYPLVFLFTGDSGEKYGYEDEVQEDDSVIYTGKGREGRMSYDHGNRAIGDHRKDGRELHLFRNRREGMVEYVGQYECVDSFREDLPDENGDTRSAIRFKLEPVENPSSSIGSKEDAAEGEKSGANGGDLLPEGSETTERHETTTSRVKRDSKVVRRLKDLYNNTCMVCGDRRLQGFDQGFSHAHHLMPLGKPHEGPDIPENVIIVCPNHHEDFEFGMLTIDPRTMEIEHEYEDELCGQTLQTNGNHNVGAQYLAYHNSVIAKDGRV